MAAKKITTKVAKPASIAKPVKQESDNTETSGLAILLESPNEEEAKDRAGAFEKRIKNSDRLYELINKLESDDRNSYSILIKKDNVIVERKGKDTPVMFIKKNLLDTLELLFL